MQLTKATALYAAPIPLRLILALTFVWAGLGKLIHEVPVKGEQAALLANMGLTFPAPPSPPAEQPPTDAQAAPASPAESTSADPASTPEPASEPATEPATAPDTNPESDPGTEPPPQTDLPPDSNASAPPVPPLLSLAQTAQPEPEADADARQPVSTPAFTAADFPEERRVKSLYKLALLTYTAAHPSPDADGVTPAPIWPEWAARDHWPITLAWAAAITELAAGVLIAIGLITRLSAVSIAVIMLNAAWLTELGPAIQSGNTHLGFLPDYPVWDTNLWKPLLWQLSLFAGAIALALAGPGALAIDRAPGDNTDTDELDED